MATVILTREFSGFQNVQDTWLIGFDDAKAGTIGTYELPEGYSLGKNFLGEVLIYDENDDACEILTHKHSNRPQLFSNKREAPVLNAVETVG